MSLPILNRLLTELRTEKGCYSLIIGIGDGLHTHDQCSLIFIRHLICNYIGKRNISRRSLLISTHHCQQRLNSLIDGYENMITVLDDAFSSLEDISNQIDEYFSILGDHCEGNRSSSSSPVIIFDSFASLLLQYGKLSVCRFLTSLIKAGYLLIGTMASTCAEVESLATCVARFHIAPQACTMTIKRKNGSCLHETFMYNITQTGLTLIKNTGSTPSTAVSSTSNSSTPIAPFNLLLSESQRKDRDELVLPFHHQGRRNEQEPDFDEEDDDSDPDNDLDI
jgi:hypothetical protein